MHQNLTLKYFFSFYLLLIFSTICFSQSKPLPYFTGFDNSAEKDGWKEYRTGFQSSFSWNINGSISHDYNVGGNSNDTVVDWMVSPPILFHTTAFASMKVSTYGFSTPTPDNCEVWFGTGNQDPSMGDFKLVANLSYMGPQFKWNDTTFVIPFTADSGYLAFKYKTIGAEWMSYAIDSISINATVGINSIKENDFKFTLFPNPATAKVLIQFEKSINHGQVKLKNLLGQILFTKFELDENSIVIDVQNLSKGIYIVEVFEENQLIGSRKLFIE